jgi:hypothetical protein
VEGASPWPESREWTKHSRATDRRHILYKFDTLPVKPEALSRPCHSFIRVLPPCGPWQSVLPRHRNFGPDYCKVRLRPQPFAPFANYYDYYFRSGNHTDDHILRFFAPKRKFPRRRKRDLGSQLFLKVSEGSEGALYQNSLVQTSNTEPQL